LVPIALDFPVVDIPLTAQLLVAAGTLALASATFLLAWNSFKERKANEARELAIGAYNRLRTEISGWMDLEAAYTTPALHVVWTSLKQNDLRLVSHIPKPISTQLNSAELLVNRIALLSKKTFPRVNSKIQEVIQELYHQEQVSVNLRLMVAGGFFDYVRWEQMGVSWLDHKTLKERTNDYVAKRFQGDTWEIEVLVGSTPAGGTKEAEEIAKKVHDFLDKDKDALELRDLLPKLADQAKLIDLAIQKQLKKD
jgi:hypothetical protein